MRQESVMIDPVEELKIRARVLQRGLANENPSAIARLAGLRELRRVPKRAPASEETRCAMLPEIRLKHCLALVAREAGFSDWNHASAVLRGESTDDFGTLLCAAGSPAHWNIWSASYDEARAIRAEHGGYLLAYKRQFLICDRFYIEELGLDPDDPDWEAIARDWVQPPELAARTRLYGKLLAAGPRPAA